MVDQFSENFDYTPSSLLHIFNSFLSPSVTRQILRVKGKYAPGKGVAYNNVYYDTLKDESSEASLTIIVPGLIRNRLTEGKVIEVMGFVTKKVVAVGGRIEVQVTVTDLVSQVVAKFSDKEVRALAIQQRKASAGYRDVDHFIRENITRGERVRIVVLIGKSAIIDSDIKHAMEASLSFYDLRFIRINLSSETEIGQALRAYGQEGSTDLLAISRGGGENMEVFNSPELAEIGLGLGLLFLTAIGHKEDVSLLQKVADKAFITPTALGQYLDSLYNDTIAEQQHSKARMIEAAKAELRPGYEKQVQNLQEKIRQLEELGGKSVGVQQQEVKILRDQVATVLKERAQTAAELAAAQAEARGQYEELVRLRAGGTGRMIGYVAVLVIVAVICVLVGRGCGR